MKFLQTLLDFGMDIAPYASLFAGAFALAWLATPLVRKWAISCGMVDKPSPRRINKTPIPRAGGLAIYFAATVSTTIFMVATGRPATAFCTIGEHYIFIALASALVLVGLADDRYSLRPGVKLAGQLAVAAGAHFFFGVGFARIFPFLAGWPDALVTIFWITGAINAFNLIDGLDGLATGLATIGFTGVAGALLFAGHPSDILVYCAFTGACLAFLRFNFHPANIFLGDTGSMFLGFSLSTLPLKTGGGTSALLTVTVPLLAMGVPIFDTTLAIVRRTLRSILKKQIRHSVGNDKIMTADTDHLHHRILRRAGSQKAAAWTLYLMAIALVLVGVLSVALRSKSSGIFVLAFLAAIVVGMRDMERIELWDAGRLLKNVAFRKDLQSFRRRRLLRVPLSVTIDLAVLVMAWLVALALSTGDITFDAIKKLLLVYVVPVFLWLVAAGIYRVVWSRATVGDFLRLTCSAFFGTGVAVAAVIFLDLRVPRFTSFSVLYFAIAALGLVWWRALRGVVRDIFYGLGRIRLEDDGTAERILIYGAGLRFRSYRRELVRATGDESKRKIILGILDDDILLKDHVIGGQRVWGTLADASRAIKKLRIDTVVITCLMTPKRQRQVVSALKRIGVKVRIWQCRETPA